MQSISTIKENYEYYFQQRDLERKRMQQRDLERRKDELKSVHDKYEMKLRTTKQKHNRVLQLERTHFEKEKVHLKMKSTAMLQQLEQENLHKTTQLKEELNRIKAEIAANQADNHCCGDEILDLATIPKAVRTCKF